jgi:hypothetical protein
MNTFPDDGTEEFPVLDHERADYCCSFQDVQGVGCRAHDSLIVAEIKNLYGKIVAWAGYIFSCLAMGEYIFPLHADREYFFILILKKYPGLFSKHFGLIHITICI